MYRESMIVRQAILHFPNQQQMILCLKHLALFFSSSLIKYDEIKTANKLSTFSSNIAGNDNTAITHPMTQTAIKVDDRIITKFTANSDQTRTLENEHSRMTPPTTEFLSTTPIAVDACDTDQVEVTNSPVLVITFTNETNCSLLVTAPNNTSISVKLLHSSLSDATTYFYVNKLGSLPEDCPDRYVLVSVDFAPCITMICGGQFKFYFQNTKITLEISTINVEVSAWSETQINALKSMQCESTSYRTKVKKKTETFKYSYIDVKVIHYLALCTCDCPENCMCTLRYREWLSMCTDGMFSNPAHLELLVYDLTMSGLSFANTEMDEIQQNALLGLETLEVLILEHNSLSILPATICQNLPQLKVLKLGYNLLSNLTSDLFKGQLCELMLLRIDLNNNKLTYFASDLFSSTSNLRHLDLSRNRLVQIFKDTFRTLRELRMLKLNGNYIFHLEVGVFDSQAKLVYLDLSDNAIALNQSGVFDSLRNLGTLDLSDNHISALPVGVFHFLYILNHLHLEHNYISVIPVDNYIFPEVLFYRAWAVLRTLDLSDNHISELPANGLGSLVVLVTLDLSSNYISVLPVGVFDRPRILSYPWDQPLRTLDLHSNSITTLHVNVFKLLKGLFALDVSHNVIHNLPSDVFKSLTQLKTLDLSHNAIELIPNNLLTSQENLLTLDLSRNNITTLHVNVFKSLRQLYVLDMSYNVLHEIPSDVFSTIDRIEGP